MNEMFQVSKTALAALVFTAVGVFLLGLSLYSRRRTKQFISDSLQIHGEVVGLHKVYYRGSVSYAPVIRFTASDDVTREFTDPVSSRPAGYAVGDRVRILYHRQNPEDARIATTIRLYLSSIILGLLGVASCGIGVAFAFWHLFSPAR